MIIFFHFPSLLNFRARRDSVDDFFFWDRTLFYLKNFFFSKRTRTCKTLKSEIEINTFLDRVEALKLSDIQIELFEKEVYSKSLGNGGLTKELCETFWDEIINLFYKSV